MVGNIYSIPILLLLLKCWHLNATNATKTGFSQRSHSVETRPVGMLRDSFIHQNQQMLLRHLSEGRSSVLAVREQDKVWTCASGICFALCLHRRLSLRAETGARGAQGLKGWKAA